MNISLLPLFNFLLSWLRLLELQACSRKGWGHQIDSFELIIRRLSLAVFFQSKKIWHFENIDKLFENNSDFQFIYHDEVSPQTISWVKEKNQPEKEIFELLGRENMKILGFSNSASILGQFSEYILRGEEYQQFWVPHSISTLCQYSTFEEEEKIWKYSDFHFPYST